MSQTALISIVAGILLFFLAHLILWHLFPSNEPRMVLLAKVAVVGISFSLATNYFLLGFQPLELCAVLWVDLFILIVYFFIYAGLVRSVSITILSRLMSESQGVAFESLAQEYRRSQRFEDRIRVMEKSGLLRCTEEKVTLTPKGAQWAYTVKTLSRLTGEGLKA